MAIKKGNNDGNTELANKANPFCAACILSREKITNKTVNTQNRSGIKLRLNLKNTTLIRGKAIKSPDTIYCVYRMNMLIILGTEKKIISQNIEIKGKKWYNNYVKFVLQPFLTTVKNRFGSTKII